MKLFGYKSAFALLTVGLMMISSCKKDDNATYGPASSSSQNDDMQRRIANLIHKLPHTSFSPQGTYGILKRRVNPVNQLLDGWDFSSPSNSGWNFSSPSGATYSDATNTLNVSSSSFGGNTGGTVVAGGSSLDMNYTFCFSANDQALGLNLFNLDGSNFTGLSVVVGVSGDFSALQNATGDNVFDYFHGLAFYIVYDDPASGSYDIVSWLDGLSGLNVNSKKSFAFIFDFKNGKLFMSTEGQVTVNGGSMTFNGKYLEISGFFDNSSNFDWNNLQSNIVPGFGTMGCS